MQISQSVRASDASSQATNLEVNGTNSLGKYGQRTSELSQASQPVDDTTAISSTAAMLSLALSGDSPQNSQVQNITAALLGGTYTVDPAVLASSVMSTMLNTYTQAD